MNAEPRLPKTRDEVEFPSHQFPIGEILKAMATLGVGFALATHLLQPTPDIQWADIMFILTIQACGGMAGFLFALGSRYSFRRHTGKVLGLACRDQHPMSLAGKQKHWRLSVLALIMSIEFLAASFFIQYDPFPPFFYLLVLIGWWGGFALHRYRWKSNSTIVEICENGITTSPNHFVPWHQIRVLPGELPDSVHLAYPSVFVGAPAKTDTVWVPPELMDNLLKRHDGDALADTLPKEPPE